jgi:glycosyltransferase involved in cell wall biosynthesis
MRLAVVVSHPIQYYAPIFRTLAARCDLHVFYGQHLTPDQQGSEGFGTAFTWDIDLLSGYESTLLKNVSQNPSTSNFAGCDTPDISEQIRTGSFDAVVTMGWYLKSYIQALLAARRFDIPILVRGDSHLGTPRSLMKKHIKELLYPFFLSRFDGALYVGQNSRKFYEHYRYPENRLFFSPHCVDNEWFAERATQVARDNLRRLYHIADESFVLLFAGKLVDFKRPLDVVAAAARCRENGKDVEVLVAGSGVLAKEMQLSAARLGIRINMLGFCNQSMMPEAYAAADALVLPSDGRETWGLVANEALACGKPIIVSEECGCAPDLATDGKAGRIVPLGDIAALANATTALIDSPPATPVLLAIADRYSVARAADGIIEGAEAVKKLRKGAG